MLRQSLTVAICSAISAVIILMATFFQVHFINDHSGLSEAEKKEEYLYQLVHVVNLLPAILGFLLLRKDIGKMITVGFVVYALIVGFCYFFLLHGNDGLESSILMITLCIPYSIALSIFSAVRLAQNRR